MKRIKKRYASYRVQLGNLVQELASKMPAGSDLRGVEVGVHRGDTSGYLLERFPCLTLHMVDWWTPAAKESEYWQSGDRMARESADERLDAYRAAVSVTLPYGMRARIMVGDSVESARLINHASGLVDFAFIDGDHTYDGVVRDLAAYWQLLRPGGLFSGHDYAHRRYVGVKQAVDEHAERNSLLVSSGQGKVWWMWKPENTFDPDGAISEAQHKNFSLGTFPGERTK